MGTVLAILAVCAIAGAIFSKMGGAGATEGAVAGAYMGGSCMVQAMIAAIPVLIGLWLLSKIFG